MKALMEAAQLSSAVSTRKYIIVLYFKHSAYDFIQSTHSLLPDPALLVLIIECRGLPPPPSNDDCFFHTLTIIIAATCNYYRIVGNFSREKIFTNFAILQPPTKVFSTKF